MGTEKRLASDLMAYKIDASRCALRVGDLVAPGTTIGEDFDTGKTLSAEAHGQVEGVYFSGADHALVILIRTDTPHVLRAAGSDSGHS